MAVLSALFTFFMITPLTVDQQHHEDTAFKEYLADHGYDISQMGLMKVVAESEAAGHVESFKIEAEKD